MALSQGAPGVTSRERTAIAAGASRSPRPPRPGVRYLHLVGWPVGVTPPGVWRSGAPTEPQCGGPGRLMAYSFSCS